ncbi:MAG: TRAP transporter substrate-binding protein [Firmicutes bacterium]|nr:TRAP transporter substrate-binding protein [Bacillota bacterium]
MIWRKIFRIVCYLSCFIKKFSAVRPMSPNGSGKTLKKLFFALLSALIVVGATGCSNRVWDREQFSPEHKIVIKFSHVVAENTPKGLAAQRFARLVLEKTKGRVEVQVFPNSTLYADGEEMQALQEGAVQIIAPATSKLGGVFPCWKIMDLPYAFEDIEAVHRALEGPIGQRLTKSLEDRGFVILAFWDNGFKQLTNNVKPLILPSDVRGLKFRVMINNSLLEEQFGILGATSTPIPFKDVYRLLESNQIIGQENTISNIYSKKFYRVQKYLTMTNHGYLGYVVMTDKDYWADLPEDIRKILTDTLAEVTLWERSMAAQINAVDYEQIKQDKEVIVTTLSPREREAWEKALEPLYVRLGDEIGHDLVDELLKQKNNYQPSH